MAVYRSLAFATFAFMMIELATGQKTCSLAEESIRDGITAAFSDEFSVNTGVLWMFDFDELDENCNDCGNANPASTYGCPRFQVSNARARGRPTVRRVRSSSGVDDEEKSLPRLDAPNIELAKTVTASSRDGVLPLSCEWPLRSDEIVVLFGCTPDSMAYFGLTPYLYRVGAEESLVFASIGDSLSMAEMRRDADNNVAFSRLNTETSRIATGNIYRSSSAPWNSAFALVMGTNRAALEKVANVLSAQGVPVNAFGVPAPLTGDSGRETYTILLRGAVPVYPDKWQAWQRSPPLSALRLRLKAPVASDPFQPHSLIPRQTVDEMVLLQTHDALVRQVSAHVSNMPGRSAVVSPSPRPQTSTENSMPCVLARVNCGGDNRDTMYIRSLSFTLPEDGIAYAIGSRHVASGNAHYASLAAYNSARRLAVVSVEDDVLQRSARGWIADAAADDLYVIAFARNCSAHDVAAPCVHLPSSGFPAVAVDEVIELWERPYSTLGTTVGPWWRTMILPTIVRSVPAPPPPPTWSWSWTSF